MLLYLLFQHLPIYSVVVSAPIYLFLFFFQTGNAVYAAHKAGIKHKKSHTMRVLYLLAKTSQWLQQEPMHFKNKQLMSFKGRKKKRQFMQEMFSSMHWKRNTTPPHKFYDVNRVPRNTPPRRRRETARIPCLVKERALIYVRLMSLATANVL